MQNLKKSALKQDSYSLLIVYHFLFDEFEFTYSRSKSSKTMQKGKGRSKERRRRKESRAAAAPLRESPRRRRKTRRRKRRKTTMMKTTRTRIATCPGRSASCPACEESSARRRQSHLWEIQYICLDWGFIFYFFHCIVALSVPKPSCRLQPSRFYSFAY